MSYLRDSLRALRVTLETLGRAPATVEFPGVIRPRAERFRTSFALPVDEHGEEKCIGCKSCEKICPSGVITVTAGPKRESPKTGKKRAYAEDFKLDLSACIYCELCVQVCTTDAITMVREPETPMFSREDLVLTKEKLLANATKKTLAWGRGTVLTGMQEAPKPAKKPAKKEPAGGPEGSP